MDVREMLVELVHNARMNALWHNAQKPDEYITDMLMEDGVTVQEWISVKDRLPENDTYVNVATDGVVAQAYWHNDRFYAFTAIGVATVGGVTHWMPLPQPPKGE